MRIAVVSPYYKEPIETIRRCYDSVRAQAGDVTHILVSDGVPLDEIDTWENVIHIRLPNNGDYGDTPRMIGAAHAATLGFDAVALLDSDNWYEPNHIEALLAVQAQTGASVVTATRNLRRENGSLLGVCSESNGAEFNDTNCYLVFSPAFPAFGAWGFKDKKMAIVGDRRFWHAAKQYPHAHCSTPTVNYVTQFAFHYLQNNETPPPNAKIIVTFANQQYPMMVDYTEYLRLTGGR